MLNFSPDSIVLFIVCTVILIALLCASIITILYLYQKKQLAYHKQLEDIKEQQKNEISRSRVEMQEQTMMNVTRNIHNSVSQKLALTKVLLTSLPGSNLTESKATLKESLVLLTAGMGDLRDISRSMSAEVINNNGLVKALELETDHLKKAEYKTDFTVVGDPYFLSGHTDLVLFRIAQEAISNIIKHSKASKVMIDLHYKANSIKLSIKDNGMGFGKRQYLGGTGLLNMQKRSKMLNGFLLLRNNDGAYVSIEVPVCEEEKIKEPPAII